MTTKYKKSIKISDLQLDGNRSLDMTISLLWVFTSSEPETPTGCNTEGTNRQQKTP